MENHDENESFLAEIEEKITMTRKRFIHIKRKARRVGRQSFETPLEKIHILEIVKDDRILFCTRRRQARSCLPKPNDYICVELQGAKSAFNS